MKLLKVGDLVEHSRYKGWCGIIIDRYESSAHYRTCFYKNSDGGTSSTIGDSRNLLPLSSQQLEKAHDTFYAAAKIKRESKLIRKIKQLDKKWETRIKEKGASFVISPVLPVEVKTTTHSTRTVIHTASDVGYTPVGRVRRPPSVTRWLEGQGF